MLTVAMQPVSAVVSRIDPVVTNGYVTIEAKIEQPLPKSARPEINIQGFITSNVITDALYVETPANIASHSKVDMFLVDDVEQIAEATTVSFGRIAGQYIEVLNGVEANQQLVISDMQQWQNHKQIALIN